MAYLRGEYYVYPSVGGGVQFYCPDMRGWIPDEVFDALVMMRWAEMSVEQRAVAADTAIGMGGGNFGCDDLRRLAGEPTSEEMLAALLKELRGAKKRKEAEEQQEHQAKGEGEGSAVDDCCERDD
jgi:hypothetical protein